MVVGRQAFPVGARQLFRCELLNFERISPCFQHKLPHKIGLTEVITRLSGVITPLNNWLRSTFYPRKWEFHVKKNKVQFTQVSTPLLLLDLVVFLESWLWSRHRLQGFFLMQGFCLRVIGECMAICNFCLDFMVCQVCSVPNKKLGWLPPQATNCFWRKGLLLKIMFGQELCHEAVMPPNNELDTYKMGPPYKLQYQWSYNLDTARPL